MKKILVLLVAIIGTISCKTAKEDIILPTAKGKINQILVVMKGVDWKGKVGDAVRTVFGEHQVGLPQPETLVSVTQVAPKGFVSFMRNNRSVLFFRIGEEENIKIIKNKFATPQTIVYVTAKNTKGFINLITTRGKEILTIFKKEDLTMMQTLFAKDKLDNNTFKTLKNLGISLTIPNNFKLVDDTGTFLWLRQRLKSGIARGDGTNNILVYTMPLEDENKVADNITTVRDTIGKKYIPGAKEGMYMITEQAYTPFTYNTIIDQKKAYETRGKWEVKNDFMAGPFINYTVIDKANKRLIVYEGFTYAPSINKRDFIFELEAIGKTLKINTEN